MPKVLANIIIIILVFILIALGIYPLFSGGKDTSTKAIAEQGKIDRLLEDSASVSGSTVKQYMKTAGDKVTSTIIPGISVTHPSANYPGAIDFTPNGDFVTGMVYVIVNYWPTGNTTYSQATSPNAFKDTAVFTVEKGYDVNGKLNRLNFVQIDMGK